LLFFPANDKTNPVRFSEHPRDRSGIARFILDHQTTLDAESVEKFKQIFGSLDGHEVHEVKDNLEEESVQFDEEPTEED